MNIKKVLIEENKMKIWKIVRIAESKAIDGKIYPNWDDYENNFWGKNYEVSIGSVGTSTYIVNADNDQEALDFVIDYIEKVYPNMLLSYEEVEKLEHPDEYISGGNNGRTLNVTIDQISIKKAKAYVPPGLKGQMINFLKSKFDLEEGDSDVEVAIYYYANDYHEGQGSELYSILSTSPFNPGPSTTLESEDEAVRMLYNALEDKFSNNTNRPHRKMLIELKKEAEEICSEKGHNIIDWEDITSKDQSTSVGSCSVCEEFVRVDTNPQPNEGNITGPSTEKYCTFGIKQSTPEQLRRELGWEEENENQT